jgi:hypothetical protein
VAFGGKAAPGAQSSVCDMRPRYFERAREISPLSRYVARRSDVDMESRHAVGKILLFFLEGFGQSLGG